MSLILDGNWDLIIDSPIGEQEGKLSITNTNGRLNGVFTSKIGHADVAGDVDGSNIHLDAVVKGPMGNIEVSITGTVEGKTASGSMQAGTLGTWSWRGSRAELVEGSYSKDTNLIESDSAEIDQPEPA